MDHRFYLEIAVREAEAASKEDTFPVGAVLVGGNGEILSVGRNRVFTRGDYTNHAEVDVIRQAGKLLMATSHAGKCALYTTCEPCLMCAGALIMANIAHVIWILNDDSYGAMRLLYDGTCYPQHFSKIVMTIADEPDLEARLRMLPLFRASLKVKECQIEEIGI